MSANYSDFVEIRVPTYKRPALLKRALQSLIDQTHTNWHAIVIDDSIQQEGAAICAAFGDDRVIYAPNAANLGIAANLDSAFTRPPSDRAAFLCVLEDDNYLLPDHLADSINLLDRSGCDVLLRDHLIERSRDRDSPGTLDGSTQYQGQYAEGVIDNLRLFAALFYSIGATNCGLFWRPKSGLDFSTVAYVDDVVWQERLRTLCIDRPVYMAMRPTVVWRDNGDSSWRAPPNGLSWQQDQARWTAIEIEIYRDLFAFLRQSGADQWIWSPPAGDFDLRRERVFRRVGIAVPKTVGRFTFQERAKLWVKRQAARALSKTTSYHCAVRFDRGRLAQSESPIIGP